MEDLKEQKPKEEKNRRIIIFILIGLLICGSLVSSIFIAKLYEGNQKLKVRLEETDNKLSGVEVLVRDTLYPVLVDQQGYLSELKDSMVVFKSQLDQGLGKTKDELLRFCYSNNKNLELKIVAVEERAVEEASYIRDFEKRMAEKDAPPQISVSKEPEFQPLVLPDTVPETVLSVPDEKVSRKERKYRPGIAGGANSTGKLW